MHFSQDITERGKFRTFLGYILTSDSYLMTSRTEESPKLTCRVAVIDRFAKLSQPGIVL